MFTGDAIGMVISNGKNGALLECELLRVELNGKFGLKDTGAVDRTGDNMGNNGWPVNRKSGDVDKRCVSNVVIGNPVI